MKKEIPQAVCGSKAEAQALSNFLWNEASRHVQDIWDIIEDLKLLKKKWKVSPNRERRFVKP